MTCPGLFPTITVTVMLQDAAKKALEEMFGGQQDVLAAYDAGGGSSGKVCDQRNPCPACCVVHDQQPQHQAPVVTGMSGVSIA